MKQVLEQHQEEDRVEREAVGVVVLEDEHVRHGAREEGAHHEVVKHQTNGSEVVADLRRGYKGLLSEKEHPR